jgi:RimJ/RimL family protein N-acetyltransferase
MTGPVLDTERLRLRPFTRDDTDTLHAHWTDPDVRRYLWDGAVIERAQAAAMVEESLATFAARRFGFWIVQDRADGGFVGFAGLRAGADPDDVELYYGLAPERWRRGYATEAARAVLRYGFETLVHARILIRTDGPNVASRAVIERLGGRHLLTEHAGAFGTSVSYVVEPG